MWLGTEEATCRWLLVQLMLKVCIKSAMLLPHLMMHEANCNSEHQQKLDSPPWSIHLLCDCHVRRPAMILLISCWGTQQAARAVWQQSCDGRQSSQFAIARGKNSRPNCVLADGGGHHT